MDWLRNTNRFNDPPLPDPLCVLGRIIEGYMDAESGPENPTAQIFFRERKDKITKALESNGLHYSRGGIVSKTFGTPSLSLDDYIRKRDLSAVRQEFTRAIESLDQSPREAISAASNILESVCKIYIEENGLEKPSNQDLPSVWKVVRKDLGIDASTFEDQDLQQITTGICAIVSGVGALRTHASSAHGAGGKAYNIKPRHARLAVHSAHTITLFILESWEERKNRK
jgi:hypothetical protein